ncbi:MAG: hypothetical protein HY050_07085 [Actinobacteria bacterium]|nr:hypothetical protein [Actinomycetota bacterium]
MLDSGIREVTGIYEPVRKARFRRLAPYLVTALLFSTLSFGAEYYFNAKRQAAEEVLLVLNGGKAVDAQELRDVVLSNNLNVYWVGAEKGSKYVLNAAVRTSISLRYIPAGSSPNDAQVSYREVGTFISANAFAVTQKAGLLPNGVGFVNVDGNAVYYDSRDPKNVYLGMKGADIQVEIFDPRPDQALAAAIMRGQVQKIK